MTDIKNLLKKILSELKISNSSFDDIKETKEFLDDLDNDEKIAYQLSDGKNSLGDIADKVSFSKATASNRMKDWHELGLVFKNEDGKWEHLAPLERFGLSSPNILVGENND